MLAPCLFAGLQDVQAFRFLLAFPLDAPYFRLVVRLLRLLFIAMVLVAIRPQSAQVVIFKLLLVVAERVELEWTDLALSVLCLLVHRGHMLVPEVLWRSVLVIVLLYSFELVGAGRPCGADAGSCALQLELVLIRPVDINGRVGFKPGIRTVI